MMRSVEIVLVIFILASAFIIASFFAVLPTPRQISSPNLRELSLTTLQMLDSRSELSDIVFKPSSDASWGYLETALSAALPPNMVYNLTVYDTATNPDGTVIYIPVKSLSNAQAGLGTSSETATLLVASSNATFSVSAQRIPRTLYILNCSDANGWWITGYTSQNLAADLRNMLSPYFNTTIMVQSTAQLGTLLGGNKITGSPYETVSNAIVLNTFGESVPIPSAYVDTNSTNNYAAYCYELGKRTRWNNWTWVSIVGWPLYYVSNTGRFSGNQNGWGVYGMVMVSSPGLTAFLRGLDGQSYGSQSSSTGSPGVVYFSSWAKYYSNYYGVYPAQYQTSTRALSDSLLPNYHLTIDATHGYVFQKVGEWIAGATYNHRDPYPNGPIHGSLTAIGLTRIPDVRVTVLALLMYYHPALYRTEFTSSGTSRLVVLQLGLQGGG
jgi:hypothetical protein